MFGNSSRFRLVRGQLLSLRVASAIRYHSGKYGFDCFDLSVRPRLDGRADGLPTYSSARPKVFAPSLMAGQAGARRRIKRQHRTTTSGDILNSDHDRAMRRPSNEITGANAGGRRLLRCPPSRAPRIAQFWR
jgi:hypothetical protein